MPGLVLTSIITLFPIGNYAEGVSLQNTGIVAIYSPLASDTADAIMRSIEAIHARVQLVGYEFTHPRIARTLAQTADPHRYVDVRIVFDQEDARSSYGVAIYLMHAGVRIQVDWTHPCMYRKTVVIDDNIVGLGSMNPTYTGDGRNSKNQNVFRGNPQLAQLYAQAFLQLHA